MQTKTKLSITALCIASLVIGYVLAEYVFVMNQSARIWADTTLEVSWLATGLPATSYDWSDMNEQTKDSPRIKIKMVGTAGGSVFWNTTGKPANFQETAYNFNSSNTWETPYGLAYGQCMIIKFTLKDLGQAVGTYSWSVNIYSTP